MIKVLVADDHAIVRAGLCRLIDDCNGMQVIAQAQDGHEALQLIQKNKPNVLVVDLSMPNIDGMEVITTLQKTDPDLPVIVLTMHEEDQYVVRALSAGAKGYITKRDAPEQLVHAIHKVCDGGRYLTESASEALAVHIATGQNHSPIDGLSNREIQVLRRLALGKTNREIAATYNISIKTVDTYRLRLLKKLGLRNNSEVTLFAMKTGLIEP